MVSARTMSAVVAMASSVAVGQTFVIYQMAGENRTDAGRGLDAAQAGDVIRMSLTVEHDAIGYAGGGVEMLYGGVEDGDITITEDGFGLPQDPWEIGRHVLHRIVASDGPEDATRPHNIDVIALGGKITDLNDDFFNFASTPQFGPFEPFWIESGDPIFVFDYEYQGGMDLWDSGHEGVARLWREFGDINGLVVPTFSGDTLVVSPAPGVLALFGIAGALAAHRRR